MYIFFSIDTNCAQKNNNKNDFCRKLDKNGSLFEEFLNK